jgi:glutathione S-transferase
MKLYNFSFGPYPQRVNIYLAEKRPAGVERIIYRAPDPSADVPPASIRALSATGAMPLLQDADGTVIGQSLAILDYIEDRVAEGDMRGATPATRARTREFVHVSDEATTLFALWARHGSALSRGAAGTSREVAAICGGRYFDQLRLIDRMMGDGSFIAGDQVTIADCVAMAMVQYAADFYAVSVPPDCGRLACWFERFSSRPSAAEPSYPEDKRAVARGLMEQTGVKL